MQKKIWVSSERAGIKSDRAASSETIEAIEKGTELTVLEIENRWYHVLAPSGKKGWIHDVSISIYPPAKPEDNIDDLLSDAGDTDISIQPDDTDRSIRG